MEKQSPAYRRLPIIALAAIAMKGDQSDYLAKPVNTEQLLSSLRMWPPNRVRS
jgi:CheY-like chemotaxis protein